MDRHLLRYIWRHSRREQLGILAIVLASLPFYFASLDLPKRIVNDAIQGRAFKDAATATFLQITLPLPAFLGGPVELFGGVPLPRLEFLFALSGLYLAYVLLNGAFKYAINIKKGALGERMLRRMRYDLFSLLLRFTPEAMRNVKAAEAATIIKDEVEPIGGFIGDAFVQPMFLGGQALTALAFIVIQDLWLGGLTAAIIGVQVLIIPFLRREQLRLGRQRQLASRALAGRIGEVVDTMGAVHGHGTARYERADISQRLAELFTIRFKLYKRKFAVKFLNNLLAQVTPFLFYAVGGYLALKGSLDIGQLVAVIAAYRDLPPPVKELIDWDQARQDVEIKYEQVIEQFAHGDVLPDSADAAAGQALALGAGPIEARGLRLQDGRGRPLLDGVTLDLALPAHVALTGPVGEGAEVFARVLSRQATAYAGHLRIAGHELRELPDAALGRCLAHAGPEAPILPGSLRDNLLYGLKRAPAAPLADATALAEARRTGNPVDDHRADWVDYAAAGATGPGDVDERLLDALRVVKLEEEVYRLGLAARATPERAPDLAARVIEAREAVRAALGETGDERLIEPFDPDRYNRNAAVGENLMFGVAVGAEFDQANLARHAFVRGVLEAEGLTKPLLALGLTVAETTVELFAGLPPGDSTFERFSFVAAEDLPEIEDIVARARAGRREQASADRERLLALALLYVEPRHRLGALDDDLMERVVRARASFREMLPEALGGAVAFHDPGALNPAASVSDNLLFGRVAFGLAKADATVARVVRRVADAMGLSREVFRLGLDAPLGGGRGMGPARRQSIALARLLATRPEILVLEDALGAFGDAEAGRLVARLREAMAGRTLIATLRDPAGAAGFDRVLAFAGGRLEPATVDAPAEATKTVEAIGPEAAAAATRDGSTDPAAPPAAPDRAPPPTAPAPTAEAAA